MEEKDETMKKIDWELKKRKLREKVSDAAKKAYNGTRNFCAKHEEGIKKWAPVVLPAVGIGIKQLVKDHRKAKEDFDIRTRHWDPRVGDYFWSRRVLTAKEKLELNRLYDMGYSKGEALRRMGLLRY